MKNIIIITLAISIAAAHPARAAGIPVFDAASIAQDTVNFVKELEKWRKEYVFWADSVAQAERMNEAISGVRNLGDVFDSYILRGYLPDEFATMYRAMRKKGYEGLLADGGPIWAANKIAEGCETITMGDDARIDCETRAVKPSQDQADAERLYQMTVARAAQIRSLQGQINKTEDPKAIAELQARIAIEQSALANESVRVQVAFMVSDTDRRVMEQREKEMAWRSINGEKETVLIAPTFER